MPLHGVVEAVPAGGDQGAPAGTDGMFVVEPLDGVAGGLGQAAHSGCDVDVVGEVPVRGRLLQAADGGCQLVLRVASGTRAPSPMCLLLSSMLWIVAYLRSLPHRSHSTARCLPRSPLRRPPPHFVVRHLDHPPFQAALRNLKVRAVISDYINSSS